MKVINMMVKQAAFDTLGYMSEETIMMDDSLYQYFLRLLKTKHSCEVLYRIRLLLVEIDNYPDSEVQEMVKNLVYSPTAKTNCLSFFNRLCQVCIAHWIINKETKQAIFELLDLFKKTNIYQIEQQKFITIWQEESQAFSETTEYLKLQRLIHITNQRKNYHQGKPQVLGDLLGRYPFLYKDCLLNNHSVQQYIDFLGCFKRHQQKSFNQKLSRTIIRQKQKIEVARLRTLETKLPQIIEAVPNPSLLKNQAFNQATKTFTELTKNNIKNRKSSLFFEKIESLSYQDFKIEFINYLVEDIKEERKQLQVHQYLIKNIDINLTNSHEKLLKEFIILRIGNQLLNKLIFNPNQPSNRLDMMNLRSCLGSTQLVGLLLKLTFLSPKLKYSLRQKLAHLFEYYESTSIDKSRWLIQMLENCLLAFAIGQEKATIVENVEFRM
ncbi:hypothetical protein [Crocosphaera sp.]|uniref:hypothetical protein n=1 Tax=Crocosphaera sp. TaxID=2729996 RepID=UPI00262529BE|nr:hypothetical protein [Crocosphaera sp.]MDJ0579455.1 hypothetical protein [Crocosphaera sp.]